MPKRTERKYPLPKATVLKETWRGQINALFKTRVEQPDKIKEFKAAIAARDIPPRGVQLSPQSRAKALELGIDLPSQ